MFTASMAAVALPNEGRLWSWTVQRLQPKPPYLGPEAFEPFALGYVDLGSVVVETRLEGASVDDWKIGETLTLQVGVADDSGDIWSYRFERSTS